MSESTAEDKARAMLLRLGVRDPDPATMTSGDLLELAEMVVEVERLRSLRHHLLFLHSYLRNVMEWLGEKA